MFQRISTDERDVPQDSYDKFPSSDKGSDDDSTSEKNTTQTVNSSLPQSKSDPNRYTWLF